MMKVVRLKEADKKEVLGQGAGDARFSSRSLCLWVKASLKGC